MNLGRHGDLIQSARPPCGFVVFFPPAVGEQGMQRAEAEALAQNGCSALLYHPPYLRARSAGSAHGGPRDIAGELAIWKAARDEFQDILREVEACFDLPSERVSVIGKNLGGSVGSYVSFLSQVGSIVVTGAVPALSRFWASSAHPAARKFREGFSADELLEFASATACLDLVETLPVHSGRIQVQVGTMDPWIERAQVVSLGQALGARGAIEWYSDDHAMNRDETRRKRLDFVLRGVVG